MFQGLIKKAYHNSFRKGFHTIEMLIFLFGYHFYKVQEFFNMRNRSDGVAYYSEVHLSFWNSLIHSCFMPITMCGMYLWMPTVINATPYQALEMKRLFMIFYAAHYLSISVGVTCLIIAVYSIPYIWSTSLYTNLYTYGTFHCPQHCKNDDTLLATSSTLRSRTRGGAGQCFKVGFLMSLCALLIQEIFGHWYGGDAPSRPEAVPNAIFYAIYYSVSHLTDHIVST